MKKQKPIRRMLAYARKSGKRIFLLCALYTAVSLLVPLFSVLLPKVLIGYLTDIDPKAEGILLISASFFVFGALVCFLRTYLADISYPLCTTLRLRYLADMSRMMMAMDYKYMESPTFFKEHDAAFQSTSSNDNGVEGIYHKLFELPCAVLTVLALAIFIGLCSPLILLALLVHIAVSTVVSLSVQKYSYNRRADLACHERRVRYYSNASKDFSYGKDLRLYSLRDRIAEHFKREVKGYTDIQTAIANRSYRLGFIALATLLLSDVATYGILTYLTVHGMSIADYSMYVIATTTLSAAMNKLSDNLTYIAREHRYVNDLFNFFDGDFKSAEGSLSAPPSDRPVSVEFDHVTFAYPGTDKQIYRDFSLKIPAGQKLALIGVNGAGKSTLVKLLTGLYTPDSGRILVDGHDVREYTHEALSAIFAPVFQDVNLIAFTVAQNVTGQKDGFDRQRLEAVLKQVGLNEKINALPKGIDTMMLKVIDEDGILLSGGEAQKLAIARALYKNGSCVIMDEPTSALDALAEADIYRQFGELTVGKTAIFISHRLASTRFCDEIVLIDETGLREYGTHDELMKKQGLYYDMFVMQGKYYREEAAL